MNSEYLNLPQPDADQSEMAAARLLVAVLHMMSEYAALSNQGEAPRELAVAVQRYLTLLTAIPELPSILRATCSQLSSHWADIASRGQ